VACDEAAQELRDFFLNLPEPLFSRAIAELEHIRDQRGRHAARLGRNLYHAAPLLGRVHLIFSVHGTPVCGVLNLLAASLDSAQLGEVIRLARRRLRYLEYPPGGGPVLG
jgi:hypothetical protein